jgi:hypothetical protein
MTIEMPSPMKSMGSQRVTRDDGAATLTDDMAVTLGPRSATRSRARGTPLVQSVTMRMPRHISSVVPSPQTT